MEMTKMLSYILNADSVSDLTYIVMTVTLALVILRGKHNLAVTRFLIVYQIGLTALLMGLFFTAGFSSTPLAWAMQYSTPLGVMLFLFGLMGFKQFAYKFPVSSGSRQIRIALWASGFFAVLAIGSFFLSILLGQVYPTSSSAPIMILFRPVNIPLIVLMVIEFHWTIIIFLRQTISLSMQETRQQGLRLSLWQHVWKPQGKQARGARAFAFSMMIPAMYVIWELLRNLVFTSLNLPAIDESMSLVIRSLGLLLGFFVFAIAYLDYAPEPAEFTGKLLLVTMFLLLATLSVGIQFIVPIYSSAFDEERRTEIVAVQQSISSSNGALLVSKNIPPAVLFVLEHPAQPSSYENLYTPIFSRSDQLDVTRLNTLTLQTAQNEIAKQVSKIRSANPGLSQEDATKQATLQAAQRFRPPSSDQVSARALGIVDGFRYIYYRFMIGNRVYDVGFDQLVFVQYVGDRLVPLTFLILVSSLATLFLVPRFFRTNLIKPLDNLMNGVRRVQTGERDVTVPVQYPDEIGYLTGTFNTMSATVQRRADQLVLLNEIGRSITASVELEQTIILVADHIGQSFPSSQGFLFLAEKSSELVLRNAYGVAQLSPGLIVPTNQGIVGSVAASGQSVYIPNLEMDSRYAPDIEGNLIKEAQSVLCVPLRGRDRIIGVILVSQGTGTKLGTTELALLEAIAAFAAIAIQNAQEVAAREALLRQQIAQLTIQIDEKKKEREVSEITETDYFRNLTERVAQIRNRKPEDKK
jgi:HAMP domain-containing protein